MKAVHALWIVSYVANALQVALALLTLSYCQKIAQIMEEVGHSSILIIHLNISATAQNIVGADLRTPNYKPVLMKSSSP